MPFACVAAREGGPRNGILTAIEDFAAGRDELALRQRPGVLRLRRDLAPRGAVGGAVARGARAVGPQPGARAARGEPVLPDGRALPDHEAARRPRGRRRAQRRAPADACSARGRWASPSGSRAPFGRGRPAFTPRADPGCARRARRSLSASASSAAELESRARRPAPGPPRSRARAGARRSQTGSRADRSPHRRRTLPRSVPGAAPPGRRRPPARRGAGQDADPAQRARALPRARPCRAPGSRRRRRPARPARGRAPRCARPRPSRSRRRGPASTCSRRAAAGGGRRRRSALRATCRPCRRRRRRRSTALRIASARSAVVRGPMPSSRSPISTTRRCSRACSADGCKVAEPGWRRQHASGSATRITGPAQADPHPHDQVAHPAQLRIPAAAALERLAAGEPARPDHRVVQPQRFPRRVLDRPHRVLDPPLGVDLAVAGVGGGAPGVGDELGGEPRDGARAGARRRRRGSRGSRPGRARLPLLIACAWPAFCWRRWRNRCVGPASSRSRRAAPAVPSVGAVVDHQRLEVGVVLVEDAVERPGQPLARL